MQISEVTLLAMMGCVVLLSLPVGCGKEPEPDASNREEAPAPAADCLSAEEQVLASRVDSLTRGELCELLNVGRYPSATVAQAAEALAASERATFEDLKTLWFVAHEMGASENGKRVRRAALHLCVRMMQGKVIGVHRLSVGSRFVDYATEADPQSVRRGAQLILGEEEGAEAFDAFAELLLQERRNLWMHERLEQLAERVPPQDRRYLDEELARFLEVAEQERSATEPASPEPVSLAPELLQAIRKYLQVPDTGDPEAPSLSEEQSAIIGEGYALAADYFFLHREDPWAEYLCLYGELRKRWALSSMERMLQMAEKLPPRQAHLIRGISLAERRHEFETTIRIRGEMWQDFKALLEAAEPPQK